MTAVACPADPAGFRNRSLTFYVLAGNGTVTLVTVFNMFNCMDASAAAWIRIKIFEMVSDLTYVKMIKRYSHG